MAMPNRLSPNFPTPQLFFTEVYHSGPQNSVRPEWMPSPSHPEVEMDCSPFSANEVVRVIKKLKLASTPSPYDRVGYVFKKCPALIPVFLHLFSICWTQSVIPRKWKSALIKLIAKSSVAEDPTNPGNFRPIALTPCIGKIFTTLLRNRWLSFMTANGYLNSSLQKAFMPTVPGCTEHHLKLSSILIEAHSMHKSLAVCWLDLANAYGSVHHSLINFSFRHYHAPPQLLAIVQSLYSGPTFSLQNGRPQSSPWKRGDPLSVVILNTVMNTLIDTISTRIDLGYKFFNSSRKVTILQYADDTCLVANSPASCQHLLSMVSVASVVWNGCQGAKVPVHFSAGLHWEVGRPISPAEWDDYPFLHKCCVFPRNASAIPTICHFCEGGHPLQAAGNALGH